MRLHSFHFLIVVYGICRWDLSLVDRLPDYIKITFEFFLKTSNELIAEVAKTQERDMSAYIRKTVCVYKDRQKQLKHFAAKSLLIFILNVFIFD